MSNNQKDLNTFEIHSDNSFNCNCDEKKTCCCKDGRDGKEHGATAG